MVVAVKCLEVPGWIQEYIDLMISVILHLFSGN